MGKRRNIATAIALASCACLSIRTFLEPLKPYYYSKNMKQEERIVFDYQAATKRTAIAPKYDEQLDSYQHQRPRLVVFHFDGDNNNKNNSTTETPTRRQRSSHFIKYPMTMKYNDTNHQSTESSSGGYREFERHWFEDCQPSTEFPIRPTCNSIHEVDFFTSPLISLLSMEGSWRSVWRLDEQHQDLQLSATNNSSSIPSEDEHSGSSSLIFKAMHTHRDYNYESFTAHAMDSMVMERLQASPYVVSSFGFCGQSVITEFAKSSGRALLKLSNLNWLGRIRLAKHLARGLTELHALSPMHFDNDINDYNKLPLQFAHHDINIANIVSLNPPHSIQWNDFNLGILARQEINKKDSTKMGINCDVPIRYAGPPWRSPEEVRNETGLVPNVHASDVYSLGNVLFTVLTKQQPWSHLEEPEKPPEDLIAALKRNGTLPTLPLKFLERPEANVIWEAAKACFRFDPEERPTASELAKALGRAEELFRSENKTKPTLQEIEDLFATRRA